MSEVVQHLRRSALERCDPPQRRVRVPYERVVGSESLEALADLRLGETELALIEMEESPGEGGRRDADVPRLEVQGERPRGAAVELVRAEALDAPACLTFDGRKSRVQVGAGTGVEGQCTAQARVRLAP